MKTLLQKTLPIAILAINLYYWRTSSQQIMVKTRSQKEGRLNPPTQTIQRQSNSNDKLQRHTKCAEEGQKHDENSLIGADSKNQGGAKANVTLAAQSEYEKESSAEDEVTSSTGAESNKKGGPEDDAYSCLERKEGFHIKDNLRCQQNQSPTKKKVRNMTPNH